MTFLSRLLTTQRKLVATAATGLALLGAFVFGVMRGGDVASLYRIFADAATWVLGLYVAGNSTVHLWEARFGKTEAPPGVSREVSRG